MDLTKKEVEQLQEQIIIIYKIIYQNNAFNSFFCEGIDVSQPKSPSNLINKLNELQNAEDVLKRCIIELEEIKENKNFGDEIFPEIMARYDLDMLHKKYGINEPRDIDKLKIKQLLGLV